jgi:hypothetical protein
MNQLRNHYLYQIKGTIHGQETRKIPTNPQHFYQLNITCENQPISKIFVFKPKTTEAIWQAVEQKTCFGQRYLFYCKNYRGYYHVLDWEALPNGKGPQNHKKCQYQAPGCQKIATYQHHQKLGAVTIGKQWVCGNCKKVLENDHD